jgi:uroporphyrinogen decarboxylase
MSITPELSQSRFLRAVRGEPVDAPPVWIMRQAGRYMPEYMAVRSRVTFMELCKRPELAAEVTLTAQQVLGVDAAILFADLLPILEPMGLHLEYQQGEGPVIHNPLRIPSEIDRIRAVPDVAELGYVFEAVKLIRAQLPANIPLLGFAGCPFTLASYAIEGAGSKNYAHTKRMMYACPTEWKLLMVRLVDSLVPYLIAQINAGCQAVQVFDSWVGCLCPEDYRTYVLPYTKSLISRVEPHAPVISFLTGNPALIPDQITAGGQVLGVDWRADLAQVRQLVGSSKALQGNLDPVTLLGDWATIEARTRQILKAGAGGGHIFNLGHGVLPETKVDVVKQLVEFVHAQAT